MNESVTGVIVEQPGYTGSVKYLEVGRHTYTQIIRLIVIDRFKPGKS